MVLGVVDDNPIFVEGVAPTFFTGGVEMFVTDWYYVWACRVHCIFGVGW